MTVFFNGLLAVLMKTAPWWGMFCVSFVLAYVFTPVCRVLASSMGMVDHPSSRRINKVPIPRGGGLAIHLAVTLTLLGYIVVTREQVSPLFPNVVLCRLMMLSTVLVGVGLLDDRFGLPPLVKLAGQVAVALGAFIWCDLGFAAVPLLDWIPMPLDCVCTVFWIVGAVNAFNLIDGLDGLATGLALIAAIGMGGALFFIGYPQATLAYFVLAGACVAFLRYNFHPASIFLGDTGSMYLGFMLATLPLCMKSGDSLFVSVGVPLLAMGVPIFDTALAIIRRSLRAMLKSEEHGADEGGTKVMQADTDHLHHRILRKFVSQRKAAWTLYGLSAFFVAVGFGGLALRDRAAGLFIIAFIVGVTVVVKDMRRIELWDAGRLLNLVAHDHATVKRRRRRLLTIPYYVVMDALLLSLVFVLTALTLHLKVNLYVLHTALPMMVVPVFLALIVFRAYSTVWSRAMISNFLRLAAAIFLGTATCAVGVIFMNFQRSNLLAFCGLFFVMSFLALSGLRLLRPILRDVFYGLDAGRLADRADTSRVVVYGAGLRYQMFRRELVRTSSNNHRIIVGLLDDDILMRGLFIGGIRVYGTLIQAKEVLTRLRADAVVIACTLSPERMKVARQVFAECGVKVSVCSFEERSEDEPKPRQS